MPKKSKKSKSKRVTLRQKHKVLKKVAEHHRKLRKAARKSGRKPKAPKDPGIPSQWPFKAELVKELEWEKQRAKADQLRKREERRQAQAAVTGGEQQQQQGGDVDMAGQMGLEEVQEDAAARQRAFESQQAKASTSGSGQATDGSRRAFYKEFARVVDAADVVIQVLDARDPLSSRTLDVERYVRAAGADKKLVLLLNKIDLVPREVAEAWLKYLREEAPTVAFKCSTQKQAANLGHRRLPQANTADKGLSGAECLGAEALLQLLKNYARAADRKTAITVGVVGQPNVGKSSLINSLKRARVAQTGNTPGVTRAVQQVHLDKTVTLLDSPGIVFSAAGGEAAAALRNATKVEQLADPIAPAAEVVARCGPKQLMALYKVGAFDTAEQLLASLAAARGKLRKGGTPDLEAAARMLLHDWNDGRIAYYTLPPQRPDHGHASAEVVPGWSADFNADEAFAAQQSAVVAGLPSLQEGNFIETQPAGEAEAQLADMQPQADAGPRPMADSDEEDAEAGSSSGEEEEEDAAMSDGEVTAAKRRLRSGTAAAEAQAAKLYAEAGQFNPHAARAQRKQTRKLQRRRVDTRSAGAAADDFDFAEAFQEAAVLSDEEEA